jgi:protein SCO1
VSDDTTSESGPRPGLSDAERARAFATSQSTGRASLPPAFFKWAVAVIVVLGGGGALLERVMSGATPPVSRTTLPVPSVSAPVTQNPLTSSLTSLLGLKVLGPTAAPALELTTQSGAPWRLADQRGHVVLVTFYDASCRDICPVLGAEIRGALTDLGTTSAAVRVAIVNTDPGATTASKHVAALDVPGLSGRSNVWFLTGSLNQLNDVWTNYGVAINVGAKASQIAHNNVLYFVDPRGRLRALAVPFANENASGSYSLGAAEIARFARGLANVAGSLIR